MTLRAPLQDGQRFCLRRLLLRAQPDGANAEGQCSQYSGVPSVLPVSANQGDHKCSILPGSAGRGTGCTKYTCCEYRWEGAWLCLSVPGPVVRVQETGEFSSFAKTKPPFALCSLFAQ